MGVWNLFRVGFLTVVTIVCRKVRNSFARNAKFEIKVSTERISVCIDEKIETRQRVAFQGTRMERDRMIDSDVQVA